MLFWSMRRSLRMLCPICYYISIIPDILHSYACSSYRRLTSNNMHTTLLPHIKSFPPSIYTKDFRQRKLIWQPTQPTNQSSSSVYPVHSHPPDPVVKYHPTKSLRTLYKKRLVLIKLSSTALMMER